MPSDDNNSCSSSSSNSGAEKTATSIFSFRSKTSVNIINSIRDRDWVKFCELIATPSGIEKVRRKTDKTQMSVLGMVLGCRAPYDVVEKVINIHPVFVIQPDKFNALPIHIACLNGTSVQVAHLLLERGGIETLYHSDSDGRLPIHHAVEFAATKRLPGEPEVDEDEALATVQFLCDIAADTLQKDDKKGNFPMCLAHIFTDEAYRKTNLNWLERIERVITVLRETNIKIFKIQQAQREGYLKSPPCENTKPTEDVSDSSEMR